MVDVAVTMIKSPKQLPRNQTTMSEIEMIEAFRIYDEAKTALAKAEEDLHVGMAARQFRRGLRASSPQRFGANDARRAA